MGQGAGLAVEGHALLSHGHRRPGRVPEGDLLLQFPPVQLGQSQGRRLPVLSN